MSSLGFLVGGSSTFISSCWPFSGSDLAHFLGRPWLVARLTHRRFPVVTFDAHFCTGSVAMVKKLQTLVRLAFQWQQIPTRRSSTGSRIFVCSSQTFPLWCDHRANCDVMQHLERCIESDHWRTA